jgi:hypothetical protein
MSSPNLEYFKWINGSGNEIKNYIVSDINFNTYYLGNSTSTNITINNIVYSRTNILSSLALYLIKFDAIGNVLWFKWIESSSTLSNEVITIYANKYVYISANVQTANSNIMYATTITPVATSTYNYNTFVMKINCNDGSNQWTRFIRSNLGNYIYSMLTDNLGILYLFGTASANNPLNIIFNGISYSKSSGTDSFLLKINNDSTNTNKSIKWIAGPSNEKGSGIALDKFKNIYMIITGTGITNLIIDGLTYTNLAQSELSERIFLLKLNNDQNNSLSWIKTIDGSGNDSYSDIKIDNSNNILLCGYSYSNNLSINNVIYQNRPIGSGLEGAFLIKFDTNGNTMNFIWIDGLYTETAFKILVDNNNNYYFTGRTTTTNLTIYSTSNSTTYNVSQTFLIKFDFDFQVLWVENLYGMASSILTIICNNKNDIFLSGSATSYLTFKGVTYTKTGTDSNSFIIKLKSDLLSDIEINMVTLNDVDFLLNFQVNNLSNLFPITYKQDATNTDLFNVDVSMNHILMEEYLSNSINPNWSTSKSNDVITSGLSGTGNLPNSLLEIIALRVFGNGKARAAITNDTLIDDSILSEKSNFFNALTNKKYELFKRFQQSDRFDSNSAFNPVIMNLNNTRLSFPVWLTGSIAGPDGNVLSTFPYSNGYNSYNGLGKMSNGVYNIPILIRFFQL